MPLRSYALNVGNVIRNSCAASMGGRYSSGGVAAGVVCASSSVRTVVAIKRASSAGVIGERINGSFIVSLPFVQQWHEEKGMEEKMRSVRFRKRGKMPPLLYSSGSGGLLNSNFQPSPTGRCAFGCMYFDMLLSSKSLPSRSLNMASSCRASVARFRGSSIQR